MSSTPEFKSLRAALVGCGGMGKGLAGILSSLPSYQLTAGCDLIEAQVRQFSQAFPEAATYTDYTRMLAEQKPDVVLVATNNTSHARLTIQAAESGVRGVYCEKPMATNLADGQAMLDACKRKGAALAVNHQRRLLPVFGAMRSLIEAGIIGKVDLIIAGCVGDILSDGTHLIDNVRYLAGDRAVKWVFGQIYREHPDPTEPRGEGYTASGGWRYGHPIETGALAHIEFADGLRVEIQTGTLQVKGRRYQDYEVLGSEGRLRRAGDQADPPLVMQKAGREGWQPVEIQDSVDDPIRVSLERFARTVVEQAAHPLAGESALKDLELVMAIYESARLHHRIELPLKQPRFPLELMIESNEL